MEIEGCENLPKLFISPTEKMMDEYTGSVKELRGLFKIPKTNTQTGSLHQQICNTAKKHFEDRTGDCSRWVLQKTNKLQSGFTEPMVATKNCNSQTLLKGY